MRTRFLWAAASGLSGVCLLSGCGGGGSSDSPTAPVSTPTPAATPTPLPVPQTPLDSIAIPESGLMTVTSGGRTYTARPQYGAYFYRAPFKVNDKEIVQLSILGSQLDESGNKTGKYMSVSLDEPKSVPLELEIQGQSLDLTPEAAGFSIGTSDTVDDKTFMSTGASGKIRIRVASYKPYDPRTNKDGSVSGTFTAFLTGSNGQQATVESGAFNMPVRNTFSDPVITKNVETTLSEALHATKTNDHAVEKIITAPTGDWVLFENTGSGSRYRGSGVPDGCDAAIRTLLNQSREVPAAVGLGPNDSWVVVDKRGGFSSSGIPSSLRVELDTISQSNELPRLIAIDSKNNWVTVTGNASAASSGIPTEMTDEIDRVRRTGGTVNQVAFAGDGKWIVVSSNGWKGRGVPQEMADKLDALYASNKAATNAAIGEAFDYVIVTGRNDVEGTTSRAVRRGVRHTP